MTLDYDKFLTDEEIIKLAIKACKSWDKDPHELHFGTPNYENWLYAAINETNHEMGRRLMDNPEYRQVLIDQLILMNKEV